ncbi:ATP-NAD kinase-like domain-containing protein [Jimgerdemannia flammicorona]|uniref:ATP-NAD kinase-like domain-containing protein n=1 Tax=Jimgerdemannia flammicorona TaxID=994334 RepID=A0A433Q4T5_9FUNG|nr:ATP-NAD kinase-like domain-containing protein [Jimgerdemannia flammicorona]
MAEGAGSPDQGRRWGPVPGTPRLICLRELPLGVGSADNPFPDTCAPLTETMNSPPSPIIRCEQDPTFSSLHIALKEHCNVHQGVDPTVVPCKTTTTQLADTAVVVREVSKRIGRAHVKWESPRTALIVTKPGDKNLVKLTRELAEWLIKTPRYGNPSGLTVYVDSKFLKSKRFRYKHLVKGSSVCFDKLKFWTPELCANQPHLFDFVITLGGDGTVLFTSWLFQTVVPPVIPFHLGSLGFLTPFDFSNYQSDLTTAMEDGVRINLRMRFTCTVYRSKRNPECEKAAAAAAAAAAGLRAVKKNKRTGKISVGDWVDEQDGGRGSNKTSQHTGPPSGTPDDDDAADWMEEKHVPCFTTTPEDSFEVLNDLVVDRGPSPYMSLLELFGDDHHLTTVQADGLAIATPTGSTAYSLSAGGPLTHPEIPAFLISPICPHTLSFRPMLLPDSMELRICVPFNSRSTAWASFDGRGRIELKQGDHIKVTASRYPFPTICAQTQSNDWFNSLTRCLKWNERQRQNLFVVVESSRKDPVTGGHGKKTSISNGTGTGNSTPTTPRVDSSSASSVASDPPEDMFAMFGDESASATSSGLSSFGDEEDEDDEEDEEGDDDVLEGWREDELRKSRMSSLAPVESPSRTAVVTL